ncbi:endonuclease/exonuclease/phosphatase family protein [Actinacidiphila glaucinigra]|uniref:endonuclease/exonuclease/phosphatase family protein n=1 Tax=Actinacidiphila glaucinigra TaxID=235986 RepID=UPI002DD8104C|nr:endonuclease/exonuclease/phosphatase family protein [Actinacidiphila glaucinigra]WSD59144.1 endonuclease/exonuclease/phosphatase family protein [Actinacidiphila glaucinigra]
MLRRTVSALAVVFALAATTTGTAAATTGKAPAADGRGARVLDVMTFNIHHAQGTDDVLDVPRIADVVRRSGADVVGLQEVDNHYSARSDWADQAADLAKLLGYHVVFGANIDNAPPAGSDHRIQYGTAILSRYPITASDNTWLYKSPGQEQRGLLHATLNVRGKAVQFYCTHLAASSQTDRLQQTPQIVDLIGDREPAVLVGDFNALPTAPESQPLQSRYTDAWARSLHGRGDGATYPAEAPTERIDAIYTTGDVKPLVTRVVQADPTASDHLPLISKVLVTP